jgi:hypothetical protein
MLAIIFKLHLGRRIPDCCCKVGFLNTVPHL